MPDITLKEHLKKARKKAHETLKRIGHYKKMSLAGEKGREEYWKNYKKPV